ncbi:hypothetical protein GR268_39340 [Rhizobium leguminosarum]|nr:hypothetical protein [Rhizobium leguminosarum]
MSYKVLICDDEPDAAETWVREIVETIDATVYDMQPVPPTAEIEKAIKVLLARRAALRAKEPRPDDPCLFDEIDVLIIDYDLIHVDDKKTRYTGEGVARLARVFSECGIVVVLNQFLEAQFDLGLRGHLESFADLNVDGELIATPGLWKEAPWDQFRPWYWPVLHKAASNFRSRVDFLKVEGNLKLPILDVLGMKGIDASRLSDTAFGFLAPDASVYEELSKVTFFDFIGDNSSAVDTSDSEALLEKDVDACARIAASRVAKWLEREVLGPQDVLVDLPHLLHRCPFLFEGDIDDIDAWNAAVGGDLTKLKDIVPKDAVFEASAWLDRPAFWWRRIEQSDQIREARHAFDFALLPDFVFLEDASSFAKFDDAVEFRAGFHNPYDRRFAKRFEKIRYAPQRRFAFGTD